ncbi:MAG: hypothetical protein LBU40_04100 [Methanobrevibacter sp.]|jgi:hypothetical protein|nr:hypothetical protein [Methanobrevibacter sp.]
MVKVKSTNRLGNLISIDLKKYGIVSEGDKINEGDVFDVPKRYIRHLLNAGFVVVEDKPKKTIRKHKKVENKED